MKHITRHEFLRRAILGGFAVPILLEEACGSDSSSASPTSPTASTEATTASACTTTPAVAEGPYYINEQLNRSDITDGSLGIPIVYEFLVQNAACQPLAGAIVDIWQADRNGIYSDESSQGTAGQKFLRGYQVTDASGRCRFTSVFPGWYAGRLTHLHGKLRINGVVNPTTNFFFPKSIETAVYNSAYYAGRGQNATTVAQDAELHGDTSRYNALMMQVAGDVTSGYIATFTLTGS